MWDLLPFDLLNHVFSFLPPDSLARATSVCRQWHGGADAFINSGPLPSSPAPAALHPPWFLAMHTRDRATRCYGYNPVLGRWHTLPLDIFPHPLRPVASVGGLILCRPLLLAHSLLLRLTLFHPLTKRYSWLPDPIVPRANPAVGVAVDRDSDSFRVYVAGGMSVEGSRYEATVEAYDSGRGGWGLVADMPRELAVRLTVWAQSEGVYAGGVLYWVTSARVYSVMGFEVGTGRWVEVKAPEAERLASAALVRRSGRLALVGAVTRGGGCSSCCIWELGERFEWVLVEEVPPELGRRFLESAAAPGTHGRWDCAKCAGIDEAIYLYRDLCSPMLVWRREKETKWEWIWVEGFAKSKANEATTTSPIKGVLLHPSLSPPSFYRSPNK
ncbi:hypothetical protein H6P81_004186 [Aristolochia fimbriata]|uniref:F-box domain-containing protein n=1 Tax=Aristolochia fimbriata TaxID=158543 RepID=A0AAV7FHU4_ARIFI|nr:hypothetical protein H6P81_004186 [Aristolochia fimbriata]